MTATPSPLALSIATALANDGRLYWTSTAATNPDEVAITAAVIDTAMLPSLLVLDKDITRLRDLAERMALGIETHVAGIYARDVSELTAPLAEWRKHGSTPGPA